MTDPLPPVMSDPAIIAGYAVKAEFERQASAARQDMSASEVDNAERVIQLWEASNQRLTDLYGDLQQRRSARMAVIDAQLPLGPAVPSGASAADRAVLHQSFRSALVDARAARPATPDTTANAWPGTLDARLADAEAYGDDTLLRAVLTAAVENGHTQFVRGWAEQHGIADLLDEGTDLRDAIAGRGMSSLIDQQALSLIGRPPEVGQIHGLRAERDAALAARKAKYARTR